AFTIEAKNKLSARCQGKTVKYFAQAVKEICEEFEELQLRNLNGVRDKTAQSLASEAHSLDPVVDDASGVNGNDGSYRKVSSCKLEIKGSTDVGAALERCSQRQGEVERQDVNPCLSDDVNHSVSPHVSSEKRNKLYTNTSDLVMDSVPLSSPSHDSLVNEDGSHDIKVEGRSSDDDHNELTNGLKTKMAMGSKKKPAGAIRRNSSSAVPHDHTAEMIQRKWASGGSMKVSSAGNSRSGLDIGSERKEKRLLKVKRHSETEDNGREDAEVSFEEHNKAISRKKIKAQHGREKQRFQTNEASTPGKMSKCADTGDGASMVRARTSKKTDSTSPDVLDDKITGIESKRLTSGGKTENRRPLRLQMSTNDPNFSSDEDDLPPIKRRRRVSEAMSSSASISENKLGGPASRQSDMVLPNKVRSPVMQLPTKRRAVRLFDDEDDESPKTPIHGGFTNKVQSGRLSNKVLSPAAQQGTEKRTRELSAAHVISSPLQDSEKLPSTEAKPVQISPKRSPHSIGGTRPSAEVQSKHSSKAPANISQKKTPAGENRSGSASDRSTSFLAQSLGERSKPASSGDKRKATPKSDLQINDSVVVVGPPNENLGERLDGDKDGKTSFLINSKIPDSVMSMKHLIAAAQAKKRQAHLQNSHGNPLLLSFPDADMSARSPSPPPATLAYESSNTLQLGVQGIHSTSPRSDVHQFSSINQHENEELEERRVSSGNQGTGSSLSGGTEAAVARDAFEGMIETLSRTKESIGRATRLAIDCAKYGIANEVVELLIQKLENEPSLHRRVDLFFLVDSITQCSHSQRGIAGASYIPIVQAALPRLIGAAAPTGAGAQENRRQCHKVLRLWLERKILPESVLRRYMGDIGVVNDDASVGLSLRRPSRAERAIDDPIREMEGMVVDEYGSNAMFQLPGLLSAHVFDEEEEYEDSFHTKLCKEVNDASPSELVLATSRDPENHSVTPSDRRHCILEDVDGELEMEDVSGHQRDEKPLFTNGTFGLGVLEPNSDGILESAPNNMSAEWLPSPEGSPPLPPGSPPITPPLPTSPPPLSPPHHHHHHSYPTTPPPPPPRHSIIYFLDHLLALRRLLCLLRNLLDLRHNLLVHHPLDLIHNQLVHHHHLLGLTHTFWFYAASWVSSTIAFPAIISGSACIDVSTYASTSICDISFPSINLSTTFFTA
ncbi:UNVERIFIED_CONTAM: ENHANCER OF AG-4 protein 2, partial [Sesamum latifolium]